MKAILPRIPAAIVLVAACAMSTGAIAQSDAKRALAVKLAQIQAKADSSALASQLTDISLENGYAEAAIIVGGRTVKGVGGGVCQVSTTLFRAAFFGGARITEST